jgi:hypothetical protein
MGHPRMSVESYSGYKFDTNYFIWSNLKKADIMYMVPVL